MPYIRRATISIIASTAAVSSVYSTVINGLVRSIKYVPTTSLAYSTAKILTIGRESSADLLLKFTATPLTTKFQPVFRAHGTTANAVGSSGYRMLQPLADERIKVNIPACSSANKRQATIYVYY